MSCSNKERKLNKANASPNIIYNADGSPVRKVCFSFGYDDLIAQQNITESLLENVIQIGKTESLNLWSSATYTNGNIQFKQPEHATQLLNQSGQRFAGAFVHFWHYKNVLSLNDKCLQEIFRNLDVTDLVSVAQVNERFKQNAISIFPLKFGSFKIEIGDGNEKSDKWMNDVHRLGIFLPIFGEFVVGIDLSLGEIRLAERNRVLHLFAPHCSDLKGLRLHKFHLDDALVLSMEPLLARLTSLEVIACDVPNRFFESLTHRRELKLLKISGTAVDFQLLQYTWPNLETIEFRYVNGLNHEHMERFVRQNPQLKNVSLISCSVSWSIFSVIGQYLPQVERLVIECEDFIDRPTFSQNAFASLKELKIESVNSIAVSATISALAAAQAPLECLELWCSPDDQLIDAISEFKSIKTLILCYANYSISRLLRIIDNLKELDYLAFEKCRTLNADGLVRIVQNAKNLQQLNLGLDITAKIDNETCAALIEVLKNRAVNRHLTLSSIDDNWPSNPDPTHREFLTFTVDPFEEF